MPPFTAPRRLDDCFKQRGGTREGSNAPPRLLYRVLTPRLFRATLKNKLLPNCIRPAPIPCASLSESDQAKLTLRVFYRGPTDACTPARSLLPLSECQLPWPGRACNSDRNVFACLTRCAGSRATRILHYNVSIGRLFRQGAVADQPTLWTFSAGWMYLRCPLLRGHDERTNSGSNRGRFRGDSPRYPVTAAN
jgi:hypothetical protein